ncbi:unnamed protein product [Calicophoron daubneyi]|uniref:Uncharacterized protein n=1 Tax=Calicophoron daubneyi TaxID=300641 RepID=A0AAV2TIA4_CALDB
MEKIPSVNSKWGVSIASNLLAVQSMASFRWIVILGITLWLVMLSALYYISTQSKASNGLLSQTLDFKVLPSEINIGIVLSGNGSFVRAVTMLKNIMYFQRRTSRLNATCFPRQRGPLTFTCPRKILKPSPSLRIHALADDLNTRLIESLSKKLVPRHLHWNTYDIGKFMTMVADIPNHHHTGVHALVKACWPMVVARDVEKLISLDTDILFNEDIGEMWNLFDTFNPSQESGINSGVILWDLDKLRKFDWNITWRKALEHYLQRHPSVNGDQTIISEVVNMNPDLYFHLPCEWHVQLYDGGGIARCPVVWPDKNPDEVDCSVSESDEQGTGKKPHLVRLVHYDTAPKLGILDSYPAVPENLTQVNRSLTNKDQGVQVERTIRKTFLCLEDQSKVLKFCKSNKTLAILEKFEITHE